MTTLYICDPRKNAECSKTGCYLHGGECFSTQNAAYAWMGDEIMNLPTPSEPIASAEIKLKLPSLNEYIRVCRANKYEAAEFKRTVERKASGRQQAECANSATGSNMATRQRYGWSFIPRIL